MRIIVLCLIGIVCFVSASAQVKIFNNKVIASNQKMCFYEEESASTHPLALKTSIGLFDLDDFKDVYLSNLTDSQIMIYIETRMLAHDKILYLTPYYKIQFYGIEEPLNIKNVPYFIETFLADVDKIKVFENGQYNMTNAYRLIAKWQKKNYFLKNEIISSGVTTAYIKNNTPKVNDPLLQGITIRGNEILKNDTLIARFIKQSYSRNGSVSYLGHISYYITDLSYKEIAEIFVSATRSVTWLILKPEKEELHIITPDKSEYKLINAAVGVLLARHKI